MADGCDIPRGWLIFSGRLLHRILRHIQYRGLIGSNSNLSAHQVNFPPQFFFPALHRTALASSVLLPILSFRFETVTLRFQPKPAWRTLLAASQGYPCLILI